MPQNKSKIFRFEDGAEQFGALSILLLLSAAGTTNKYLFNT